jgi:aldehyde:ferredoxin oxidoreductase
MVREGRTREEDTLHESYFRKAESKPGGGEQSSSHTNLSSDQTTPVPRQKFEEAKEEYYRLRGWDEKTGHPTRAKLTDLGLEEIAVALYPDPPKSQP